MKAYLIHLFTVCGGGERVSLEMARVLRDHGFNITYITNTKEGLHRCSEILGLPSNYDVVELTSFTEKAVSITGRFVRLRRLLLVRRAFNYLRGVDDGLIVDTASNMPSRADISYIHYPAVLSTFDSRGMTWSIYNWVVRWITRDIMGKPRLLLANSTWTARLIRDLFGLESRVLHPPVDVEFYRYDGRKKEKIIVTISRLTPEKNLHELPKIASMLSDYEWFLVGTAGSGMEKRVSRRVISRIRSEVVKSNTRNFHLLIDLPRRELRDLLQRAMFYVHPRFKEHFGIAIVEAMSAGVIPIVYRDGGAWYDIASLIGEDLGYLSIEDIPRIVRRLEESGIQDDYSKRAVQQAELYSTRVFRERFSDYLVNVASKNTGV